MDLTYVILGLLCVTFAYAQHQRIPPGVSPQQYAQPQQPPPHAGQVPHQQIPQQPPVQYQQVPAQQVPMQMQQPVQVPQQIPVQQVPMQQQVPIQQQQVQQQQQMPPQHHQQQILNAANIAHEKDHIQEHLEVPIDTSKMSDQELQFHYFKMHDADNNNKLDGCELIKSLIHWHEPSEGGKGKEATLFDNDQELADIIDPILKDTDKNNDGYIDFVEFKIQESKAP